MQAPVKIIKDLFTQAIKTVLPAVQHEPMLAPSKFADYQCNSAMSLFKAHGSKNGFKSPGDLAKAIVAALPAHPLLAETAANPAGFVNIKMSDKWLEEQAREILKNGVQYSAQRQLKVLVDFSSPNIAKEMHVGHLRSTIIGESVCRMLEFAGHEVHRVNHVGDWGTQFGMLIEHMRETFPDFEQNLPNVSDLQGFYKASKARFDADADFKKRSQETVVRLQSGDEACIRAWKLLCEVSRQEFLKVYRRLGVQLEERGESFYNPIIPSIVAELKERGIVVESNGAQCIFTPRIKADPIPLMVVKGDGGFGYDSTDIAAIFHRLCILRAEWVIAITDIGQQTHFHKIYDAAETAGWHVPPKTRCDHLGLGLVCGDDGKKFKTRSGDVVKLVDLLDESTARALAELKARAIENGTPEDQLDMAELTAKAEKVGIASVKYFDMKRDITTNYQFSYDAMLDPRGNSAVFLLYAYARISQLLEKCRLNAENPIDVATITADDLNCTHPAEREVLLHLARFPEVMDTIMADLTINKMCEYLYELCDKLTGFYSQCKVVGAPDQRSKMALVKATQDVMAKAFTLLGMEYLDKL